MRAGALNRRVAIEYLGPGQDDHGQAENVWLPLCKKWVSILPLSGNLLVAAQAIVPEATVQVEGRFRDDIKAGMRVRYGSRLLKVGAALDVETKHETIRMLCSEGLSIGGV